MFQGFEPVYNSESKVLILGSFPSVKSRIYGFYYGNKQNRFWNMLEKVFCEKIPDNIQAKKAFLLKHHIALYDVIKESDLVGSSDSVLERSNHVVSDLSSLLPPHTKVQKIICNGKTSYKLLSGNFLLPIYCLPSTSPANPRYNFADWEKALEFLKN